MSGSRFDPKDVAVECARRFSAWFPFDLEPEEWFRLCHKFNPLDVLTALQKIKNTTNPDPAVVHANLLRWIDRLTSERQALATWPPSGTKAVA